jgi:hypothetical protein
MFLFNFEHGISIEFRLNELNQIQKSWAWRELLTGQGEK